MNQTLINALWITLIGMGLVFISLLLLWGLMELMVKLTSKTADEEAPPDITSGVQGAPCGDDLVQIKMRAASAAVAFLIASATRENGKGATEVTAVAAGVIATTPSAQPAGTASVWQSANRASQINQNAALYNRKPRGNE